MFCFAPLICVVLLVKYTASATCKCECKEPPLKLIHEVVPHFKDVQACNRVCKSNYGVSKDGVRTVSFSCELVGKETGSEVCACLLDYLSQKNWLEGSESACCIRNNIASLTLEGQPDPNFNQQKENATSGGPLEQLKAIFYQFPHAQLEKLNCRLTTNTNDESGCIQFNIDCDLKPHSPSKDKICNAILCYLNQDGWLGKLASKSTSNGKMLSIKFNGDTPNAHSVKKL